MSRFTPRPIRPESVTEHQKISVEFPPDKGLVMTYAGWVRSVRQRGNARQFMTQEGRILFAWEPGSKPLYKLSLLDEDPPPMSALDLDWLETL